MYSRKGNKIKIPVGNQVIWSASRFLTWTESWQTLVLLHRFTQPQAFQFFRLNYQINDKRRPQRFMYTRKDSIFVIGRDNLNVTKHGIQTKNKQLSIITWLQEVRFRPNMFERNKLQFFTTFNCEISNNHQITCMTSQRKILQFGTSLKEMTIQETKLLHALLDDT